MWRGRGNVWGEVGADLTVTPQLCSIWTLKGARGVSYVFPLSPGPHLISMPASQRLIPSWQTEKLMLRGGADLPKVTYPELEANLEPGDLGSYWLLFSLLSGRTHLGCFRLREPLHHCQAGGEAADRGTPALCLSLSNSNLEIAILLATAHSCAKLYSFQLARELRVQYLICSLWPHWELKLLSPLYSWKD